MRWLHFIAMIAGGMMLLAVSACGAPVAPNTEVGSGSTQEPIIEPEVVFPDLELATFDNPTEINNKYFPLQPGIEYIYTGFTEQGSTRIPHRKVVTVTDLTKEVAGIETVVVYTEDHSDGFLVEAEIAFYAQDNAGNVWFLGEYPEVYKSGELVEAQAWIAGLEGAEPGIVMPVDPHPRMPNYAQGWGLDMNWTDRMQVVAIGEERCVSAGCYGEVLITEEFNQQEPNSRQLKYYAPGVGNFKVGWRGEDVTREILELIRLTELTPEALAEVHSDALALEESAFVNSDDVYGVTAPIKVLSNPTEVAEFWELDPANFIDPTVINNMWMPMQPGTRWVHEGTALDDEGNAITRRIEFTVTDMTKEIAGVKTVVAWIVDYNDGEAIEKEIAFYAQDQDGNVWYFGEYPEEYEDGEFVQAVPWIHGIEDARAGIKMMSEPEPGTPPYYQGWAPAVDWSDFGQIDQVGQETCVFVGCYQNVLVIAESSLEEMDAYQLKYYAPNVGEVRVGWKGEDPAQEELELIELIQLSAQELAEVRAMALELEQRAYEISSEVYGETLPMESPS
jgi:hypothetical protein